MPGIKSETTRNVIMTLCLYRFLLFFTLIVLALNGCSSKTHCYGPNFSPLNSSVKRLGILSPDVFLYDVSAGGIHEYRDDWSRKASEQVMAAAAERLEQKGASAAVIHDSMQHSPLFELKTKFRYHCNTVQSVLYGENCLVTQIDSFTYSMGTLDSLCDLHGVDGFVYIYGYDERFSPERLEILSSSAKAKTARSACFGVLLGVLTGYYGFTSYRVPPERTFLAAVVAQRNGTVKWYRHYYEGDDSDLRSRSDAGKVLEAVLKGMKN
ncbi:MAG: hypothetical protein ACOCXC_03270 [Fibrobacterota bacterium]